MKLHYYSETDSLSIEFNENTSVESEEIAPNFVVDYDSEGNVTGLDIDHASTIVDMSALEVSGFENALRMLVLSKKEQQRVIPSAESR